MSRPTFALAGVILFLMPIVPCWSQSSGPNRSITGTLAYRQRVALPPDATVDVQLEDVSLQDAPAKVLAKLVFATEGKQVPFPFELKYEPSWIIGSHRYNLRATISADGQMLFTTTSANPVITQGAPTHVDLILQQVTQSAAAPAASTAKPVTLEGTYWQLMALGGKPVLKGIGDTKAYLILHDSDKRIAGSTGCNRLVGGYELSGDSLHFTPAGMTMMACSPPLMKQEQAFSAALGSVTSYRITGQQLELLLGDTVKARFQAKYLK